MALLRRSLNKTTRGVWHAYTSDTAFYAGVRLMLLLLVTLAVLHLALLYGSSRPRAPEAVLPACPPADTMGPPACPE